jgi:hypothetical protein
VGTHHPLPLIRQCTRLALAVILVASDRIDRYLEASRLMRRWAPFQGPYAALRYELIVEVSSHMRRTLPTRTIVHHTPLRAGCHGAQQAAFHPAALALAEGMGRSDVRARLVGAVRHVLDPEIAKSEATVAVSGRGGPAGSLLEKPRWSWGWS